MRVDFFRTGGLGNVQLTASLETTKLFPDEAVKVHKLLDDAKFFDLPENITSLNPDPDGYEYRITVDSAEHLHTVTVSGRSVPGSLRPLIDYLSSIALQSKGR